MEVLRRIEAGDVTLTPQLDPQVHIRNDSLYDASNGWKTKVSNSSGEFSAIVGMILPDGAMLDQDNLEDHMPDVRLYSPDKDVEWRACQMKKKIIGCIYLPIAKPGRFEGCEAGQVIVNPDREPPDHCQ